MGDYSLNGCIVKNGSIQLQWRAWDGIDRPDYVTSYGRGLSSQEARIFAQELLEAADEADSFLNEQDQQELMDAMKEKNELETKIEMLQNKIKKKGG